MATLQIIPDSRKGRTFRRLMTAILIASIVGIADQLRILFWFVLNGEGPNPSRILIILTGWVILCWCGYKAHRHNLAPPTWVVLTIPLLIWTYLLWPE